MLEIVVIGAIIKKHFSQKREVNLNGKTKNY